MAHLVTFFVALAAFTSTINGGATRNSRVYWVGAPIGSSNNKPAIVPASCFFLNVFCPPGYTGVGGGGGSTGGGSTTVPQNLAQQLQAALANGNSYRQQHGAPPMTVDANLQADAQRYAEQLANTGTFQHSNPGSPAAYGENLARLGPSATIAQANDAWYTERPAYCPAAAGVNTANGHFTQMVWKDSTRVGYGSAVGRDGYTYIVARYSPPGNNLATHTTNVQC